jgi:hypothetical protein
MSSIQCLDANQLIPDNRLSLYGLFKRVSDYSQDDPVHNTENLWRGIDIAHRLLRFEVEDPASLYRHRRAAFIAGLSQVGAGLPGLSREPRFVRELSEAEISALASHPAVARLREVLIELVTETGSKKRVATHVVRI